MPPARELRDLPGVCWGSIESLSKEVDEVVGEEARNVGCVLTDF